MKKIWLTLGILFAILTVILVIAGVLEIQYVTYNGSQFEPAQKGDIYWAFLAEFIAGAVFGFISFLSFRQMANA